MAAAWYFWGPTGVIFGILAVGLVLQWRAGRYAHDSAPSDGRARVRIEPNSADPALPYSHLEPIVDALLEAGNAIEGASKFYQDRDGWRCDLRKPIDFALVRRRFELPESIKLTPRYNSIHCRNTWIEIQGRIAFPF